MSGIDYLRAVTQDYASFKTIQNYPEQNDKNILIASASNKIIPTLGKTINVFKQEKQVSNIFYPELSYQG